MTSFQVTTDLREDRALIVRTDYDDASAWQATKRALGDEGSGSATLVQFIDHPDWAGASVDEVLAVFAALDTAGIVFIADRVTMRAADHPLLAVTVSGAGDLGDHDAQGRS